MIKAQEVGYAACQLKDTCHPQYLSSLVPTLSTLHSKPKEGQEVLSAHTARACCWALCWQHKWTSMGVGKGPSKWDSNTWQTAI